MAAQFFQRVAQYLANEVITKRLAQSSTCPCPLPAAR
jgi:hypothetical protein